MFSLKVVIVLVANVFVSKSIANSNLPCNSPTSVNIEIDKIADTKWRLVLTNEKGSREACDTIEIIPDSNSPTFGKFIDSDGNKKALYNWTLADNALNLSIPLQNSGNNLHSHLVILFFNNVSNSTCFGATMCIVQQAVKMEQNFVIVACDDPDLSKSDIEVLKQKVNKSMKQKIVLESIPQLTPQCSS